VDSRTDPRVQVADLLAGVARRVAADELVGRSDPDLTALLRPYVDPASRWCEGPSLACPEKAAPYGGRVEAQWEDSDAWVFAAINGGGPEDGCTLVDVIRHGDAINHAVMSEAEFTRAVPRLINAGLVGADRVSGRYWRTREGQELFARRMRRRGLFGWMDAIPPALRRLGPPQDGSWELEPGEYERVLRRYPGKA